MGILDKKAIVAAARAADQKKSGCVKRYYYCRSEAQLRARVEAGNLGKVLRPYKCKRCEGWHLTKQRHRPASVGGER